MISKYQEKVAKGRGIIKEVNESFKAVNLEDTTKQLVQVRLIIFIFSRANGDINNNNNGCDSNT